MTVVRGRHVAISLVKHNTSVCRYKSFPKLILQVLLTNLIKNLEL